MMHQAAVRSARCISEGALGHRFPGASVRNRGCAPMTRPERKQHIGVHGEPLCRGDGSDGWVGRPRCRLVYATGTNCPRARRQRHGAAPVSADAQKFSSLIVTFLIAETPAARPLRGRAGGTRERVNSEGRAVGRCARTPRGDLVVCTRAGGRGRRGRRGVGRNDAPNDWGDDGDSTRDRRQVRVGERRRGAPVGRAIARLSTRRCRGSGSRRRRAYGRVGGWR